MTVVKESNLEHSGQFLNCFHTSLCLVIAMEEMWATGNVLKVILFYELLEFYRQILSTVVA